MQLFENYIIRLRKSIYRYYIIFGVSLIVFFVLAFLYLNTSVERNQFQHIASVYNSIKDIKNKETLSINSLSGSENIEKSLEKLSNYSTGNDLSSSFKNKLNNFLSNLYLLNKDFKSSKEFVNGNKRDYYFNLGNINLFKGYFLFTGNNNNDLISSYNSLEKSIEKYNISLKLLGSGENAKRNKVFKNKSFAEELKFAVGIKYCISMFKDALEKIISVNKKISKLLEIFQKEQSTIPSFKKQLQDNNLKQCLTQFQNSVKKSRSNTLTFQQIISTYKNKIQTLINNSIESPNYCIKNKDEFQENINSSTEQISKSLDNYIRLHSVILQAIQQKNKSALEKLCENTGNFSKKTNEFSQELNEGIKKLQKTLGERKKEEQEKNENTKNSNDKKHEDIPKEQEEKLKKEIKDKSDNWLEQMNKMKGEKGYNPRNYLENLFDQFHGNDEGFQQKGGPNPNEKSW